MTEINVKSGTITGKAAIGISDGYVETMVVAAIAAVLSLLHKGFVFGVENTPSWKFKSEIRMQDHSQGRTRVLA